MVVVPSPQEAKADLGSRIKRVGVHALTDGHRGNDFAAGAVHHRHCFAAAIAEEQPVVFQINRHAGNFFPQAKPNYIGLSASSRYALLLMKSPFKLHCGLTFLASLSVIVLLAGCKTGGAPVPDVSHYPADAATELPGKGPLQTWTDYTNIWAERHAAWRRDTNNETGAVVFLGDSITQGWNSLARTFPDIKVVNRGIGGDTTRGVLYRLNADVLTLKPTAVVLLIGINDIGLNADPQDVADNIKAILQDLKQFNPRMPVIVCKVMPSSEKQHRPTAKIEQLNALVDEIVKSDPHFILCDTWSIYADANGECKKDEFPDWLHPNAIGYAKWANALKPIFARLNLRAAKVQ